MKHLSELHRLVPGVLLIGCLMLSGCPKRPEMGQAGAGAIGPAAAVIPSPTPPAAAVPPREPAVKRPTPPEETATTAPSAPAPAPAPAPALPTPGDAPPQSPAPPAAAAPLVPIQPAPAPRPEPSPQVAVQPPAPAPAEQLAQAGAQPPGSIPASPLKDIFFDFDEATLREDQRAVLSENVAWLTKNRDVTVTIEGHCDERGTSEYNIGLGERRAKVVKDYLVAGGVNETRIQTMSYGEERPFVLGHDESAWKWNRRAHFLLAE